MPKTQPEFLVPRVSCTRIFTVHVSKSKFLLKSIIYLAVCFCHPAPRRKLSNAPTSRRSGLERGQPTRHGGGAMVPWRHGMVPWCRDAMAQRRRDAAAAAALRRRRHGTAAGCSSIPWWPLEATNKQTA